MRTKRFLLVTAALSTATACGKDAAVKPGAADAAQPIQWPANPKGSYYDSGLETPPPPPPPVDGGAKSK